MISVQPIKLWRYIGFKRNKIPNDLSRLFYLSWEDAFWDLLEKKNIPKNSLILLPNFYCGDVEQNIIRHGYQIKRYRVLKNLTVQKSEFINSIKKYNPKVIIIFHPVGINSNLFEDTFWIKNLSGDTILIEDGVHRILNPNKIKIYKRNHFVIDSLRKVVPLQGSNVYGLKADLNFKEPRFHRSFLYSMKVHVLWFLMVLFWAFGLYKKAEKFMLIGYNLIGDEEKSAPGFFLFKKMFEFVNYEKIYRTKERQVGIYKKYIKSLVRFNKSDWGEMRGYPVILENSTAQKTLGRLRKANLMVRFELNDSKWSKNQKIIYLPLGLHLSDIQIMEISRLVLKSLVYE